MTDVTTQNTESLEITESIEATEAETKELIEVETFDPSASNVDNMLSTLPLMGKGMLGIFLVTILIVAAVAILNKTTNRKPKEE